jgi:hypothetical protein
MKKLWSAAILSVSVLPCAGTASAQVSIGISVNLAPPPLPVYAQPPLPGPDYIWTPGYWAWDDYAESYFWVPGTWVLAPRPGLLWTPPWWGWSNGVYVFHSGYWGPHVGFYGGVPYGFGYTGFGYQGGYWNGGHVYYNRTVTNITNVTNVTNIYQRNVVVNHNTRVSYNGGPGGLQARASAQELAAAHEFHVAPTGNQQAHLVAAWHNPSAFASANHGHPPMAATARPLDAARVPERPMPGHSPGGPAAGAFGSRPYPAPSQTTRFDRPFRGDPRQAAAAAYARQPAPRPQPHWAQPPQHAFAPPPQRHWASPPQQHYAPPRVAYRPAPPPRPHGDPRQGRHG